ncbi:hypothetical protein GCM10023168_27040 [Fodinibacter luteus]|uniref:beta-fructofuranosidase n=2 Tax=Fodinibacter luteus TaxID=552064 RepID=A0ABP8KL12_9MICO
MPGAGHRPLVHLTPRTGWVNDPLGLTWHAGRYHLFAQHVPGSVDWSPACHWSHATSEDLLRWRHQPVALAPGDGDAGVWSGCVVVDERDPAATARLFYTSVADGALDVGSIRVARPLDDDWTAWEKGPVVVTVPEGYDVTAFRDPFVLRDGDRWRMLVGGGLADGTAVAWTWVSPDLETWTPDGELARRHTSRTDPVWTGSAWECPQLLVIDDRWVLLLSVWEPGTGHHAAYALGELADGRFTATAWARLSFGPAPYAPSAFVDREGRPGVIHWLRGVLDPDGAWAGALSVPHVLSLDGDVLVAEPHPVVTTGPVVGVAAADHGVELPAAAWVEWDASGEHRGEPVRLALTDATGTHVAELVREGARVTVTTAAGSWDLPTSIASPAPSRPTGILIDHLVLEVFTHAGVLGAPLPPATGPVRLAVDGPGRARARRVG